MNDDQIPASFEQQMEVVRRGALDLDAWSLDEQLAVAAARRDVAAAHGKAIAAEMWNNIAIEFADIRKARADFARELDALTSPAQILRRLTDAELGTHDDGEPPC